MGPNDRYSVLSMQSLHAKMDVIEWKQQDNVSRVRHSFVLMIAGEGDDNGKHG